MLINDPTVPRPIDVVTIRTETHSESNPLLRRRTINGYNVIGSASPCDRFLVNGERVAPALRCLRRNGFKLVCERRDLLVLRRVP